MLEEVPPLKRKFAEAVAPYAYVAGYTLIEDKNGILYRGDIYTDVTEIPEERSPCTERLNKHNITLFGIRVYDTLKLYPSPNKKGHHIVLVDKDTHRKLFPPQKK